ncbi:MAG: hypothetical protein JOZ19_10235 [Rubrobacter sp.]|nr:hypothetical protein [Rubrobacter sp.]
MSGQVRRKKLRGAESGSQIFRQEEEEEPLQQKDEPQGRPSRRYAPFWVSKAGLETPPGLRNRPR